MTFEKKIIEEAYTKSIELLKNNGTRYGFIAASVSARAKERWYVHIFGRDAMICALGALASGDEELMSIARKSLETLAKNISKEGQIPFAVEPKQKFVRYHLPQSVDGNVWWLILYWLYSREAKDQAFDRQYKEVFYQAIAWLKQRMYGGLIEQGEASDWADEMPRQGLVLYTNALWLLFLRLIGSRERQQIYNNFLFFFSTDGFRGKDHEELMRMFRFYRRNLKRYVKVKPYFLAAVSRVSVDEGFDVFGNILACLSGFVETKRVMQLIGIIGKERVNEPVPVRVLSQPIRKDRQGIFEVDHQNKPWHYHNGGAWPMAGGFWVYLLAKQGQDQLARSELERLAQVNSQGNWGFYEFFHGKTGKPMGMKHQSWNAATYILGYQAVMKKKFII